MSAREGSLIDVVWTETSLLQLQAIRAYINRLNPQSAAQVASTLRDAGNSLASFPLRGRAVRGTKMRELVTLYPYIIRYRVTGDVVFILRIRHAARRPTRP